MKNQIYFEDNHLLIVEKPAGMLVHGDNTGDRHLLDHYKHYIKEKYRKPGAVFLHAAHRIDRPVSGIIVMAKTSKALERLVDAFRKREVSKVYLAVVQKFPDRVEASLVHWLAKDRRKNKSSVVSKAARGKRSVTNYKLIAHQSGRSLLLVNPITGRPHQIRVQLAETGHSIIGDLKYGGPRHDDPRRILLHHAAIHFIHPVRKHPVQVISVPPPVSGWQAFSDWTTNERISAFVGKMN